MAKGGAEYILMRGQTKREVTQEEFEKFLKEYPRALRHDGMRYTEDVNMRGLTWRRPVAAKVEGKFFLMT
jgi:hypothetical protein